MKPSAQPEAESVREVVVIDTGIEDWRTLARGVSRDAMVVLIEKGDDGLGELAEALRGRTGIRAIHVISHGGVGAIRLGATRIDREVLDARSGTLRTIRSALGPGADILLAGCDVAYGGDGARFIQRLSELTGADVAGSTDTSGSERFGANWVLESRTGAIEATLAPGARSREAFRGQLEIASEVTFGFSKYDGSLGNGDTFTQTIEADGTTDQMSFSQWRIDEFDDPDFGVNMNNGGPDSGFSDPNGDNFQFVSFTTEVFCGTSWSFDVVGYRDGSPVAGASESYSLGGVGGPTTRSVGFASVDEVRFENYATDNGNQCLVIDDIVVDQAVVANTAPSFSNLDATVMFDEAAGTPVVVDADATVADTEHDGANDYAGSTLTVAREGGANADDDFGFDTGAGTFTVSGGDLLTGGNIFASFTDNSGTLTVSFNSSEAAATSSLVDDVLQGVTYANTGSPVVVEYGLTLNFDDGGLQTSDSVPVEFDPVLAAVTANTTYDLTELGPELSNLDSVDARIITESTYELLFFGFRFGDAAESGSIDSNELQLDQVTADEGTTGVRFEADEPFSLDSIDIDNFSGSPQSVEFHAYLDGTPVDSRSFSFAASNGYVTRQFASANAAFTNVDEIRITTSVNDQVGLDNIVVDQGNAPPTLDLDTGGPGGGHTTAFSENADQGTASADGVAVTGPVTANDPDGSIETVTLAFDNPQGDTGEGLAIDAGPLAAALGISPAANLITINRNTATNAELVEAIEAVRYQNNSDIPDTTDRTVTVEVTDDRGATASAMATVTVEAGNDAPSITAPGGTLQPDEDVPFDLSGANEIQIGDVDAGSETVEVSLSANDGTLMLGSTTGVTFDSGGNGTGAFIVSGTVTVLNSALATLSYQGDADFFGADTIDATVNDRGNTGTDPGNSGDGSSEADSTTVTLDVQPIPDAPTISAIADQSTDEDTTLSGIAFTIDDVDTPTGNLMLSFASDTPSLIASHAFGGSGASRTLQITPAANDNGSAVITVEVSDGSLTATENFVLTVNAVNDLPTVTPVISTLDQTITEDSAVPPIDLTVDDVESGGAGVAVAASSDNQTLVPDANLSVTDNGGGDRTLEVTLAPDGNGVANITVTLDDGADTVDDSFQLTVDAENDPPAVSLDQNSETINEGNSGNVIVAQITVDDDNEAGSTNNLSLSGPDAGDFTITSGDLVFTGSADYETQATYSVVVEIDDPNVGASPNDTAGFTLNISDVDDPPVFSETGPFAVSEAAGNGTAVGDVDAVDGDGGATDANVTFAIVGGNTGSAFAIDGGTGAITVADASAVDFEATPSFALTVEADDGDQTAAATVTVNVDNEPPDRPTDADPAADTVPEDAANGVPVGVSAQADDPSGGTVTYALADDAGGRFAIDASSGEVTVADALQIDFETVTSHTIEIEALDPADAPSPTLSVTIAVTDVQDDPTVAAPPDLTGAEAIDATGLYTEVDLEGLDDASADDDEDGGITPEPIDVEDPVRLRPGTHEITWSATDSDGGTSTDEQIVEIRPRVGIGPDQTVQEGTTVELPIELNGDPIDGTTPKVYVNRAGSGSAGSGDFAGLVSSVEIVAGRTALLNFDVLDDATSGEGPETLVIELTGTEGNTVLAGRTRATITIVEGNTRPVVSLAAEQGADDPAVVIDGTAGGDPVTVTASTYDATAAADMSFDWNGGATGLFDLGNDADPATFEFDPTVVPAGVYGIEVEATDDGSPAETGSAGLRLRVVDTFPPLGSDDTDGDDIDDGAEGRSDRDGDGLPDYLDPYRSANTIHQSLADEAGYRIEAEPGLNIALGPVAFGRDVGGARVTAGDIANILGTRDDRENVGGYFDFTVRELPIPGRSVRVVIPQREPIPPDAVYRKLGAVGGWMDFIEDGRNALASTPGAEGFCPPPDAPVWTTGLTAGDWCVRLTIEDGGPNDADGVTDGRVTDPGGVAQGATVGDEAVEASNDGGGALGPIALLLLLFGTAGYRRVRSQGDVQ